MCLERLRAELPEQQFNTWIRPLPAADVLREGDTTVFNVRVPNRFILDWIRTQYSGRLEAIATEVAQSTIRLDIALAQRPTMARPSLGGSGGSGIGSPMLPPNALAARLQAGASGAHAAPLVHSPANPYQNGQEHDQAPMNLAGARRGGGHPQVMGLNPALTFDNLVPGRANQMARTAALHVAGAPGQMYNPLFIYGGVGLGKTHLMNAVGNALLADKPDARILYLHAEQFISDVVKNYQRKTFDELKAKYHQLDLLLIDDVQFFAGKDRTQEEFFNAFEALLAKKAHIIMTSDTYPKGLANIDERLTSRFDSGLTVAIEPPELEMRVAILISKARAEGAEMPEDVAFFVAKNVRANVRELEGALRKVIAYARF
ncbi:MAG TPA: chromosomal replication initiator protein DnaA, partial [Aquabacterium sp.]|nr:chromosomal replication initiator protein DnaA [Aquabacterium sp.]